ncbi:MULTISPECIES: phosphatase PAP2 family protein [Pedobacter]|uniref:phosphatase PAP2 family protein n=1 Tax=Pedobacter TaxID=84567 RepID=UPI001E3BD05A|nr:MULTISPECIES: phosphatase PAP2 family protein [Pedobacter]
MIRLVGAIRCGFICFLLFLTGNVSVAQQVDTTKNLGLNPVELKSINEEIKPEKFKVTHFIAPVVLIGYGFATVYDHGALQQLDFSTRAELQEDHPRFAYHVDDYAQFAPMVAVYALNLTGIKGRHNLFDASMLYFTSAAIMGISTHFVKQGVHRLRPDGSGYNSFPSGHTASAFAAAEFLYQEFKYKSPWIGYAGYFVATATGTLRMYNNKHWFSDVVAGAGFGIASTKLGYLVYPQIKKLINGRGEKQNLTVMPTFEQHQLGYRISYKL